MRSRSSSAGLGALLLLLAQAAPAATLYKWQDASGAIHLSTGKPPRGARILSRMTVKDEPVLAPEPAALPPDESMPASASQLDVVMYATRTCPWCQRAREYLSSRGVTWREVDIESSAAANREFRAHGGQGTPLIIVNGTSVLGWNPARLGPLLDAARASNQ